MDCIKIYNVHHRIICLAFYSMNIWFRSRLSVLIVTDFPKDRYKLLLYFEWKCSNKISILTVIICVLNLCYLVTRNCSFWNEEKIDRPKILFFLNFLYIVTSITNDRMFNCNCNQRSCFLSNHKKYLHYYQIKKRKRT